MLLKLKININGKTFSFPSHLLHMPLSGLIGQAYKEECGVLGVKL